MTTNDNETTTNTSHGDDEKKIGLVELVRALAGADAPRGAFTEVIRDAFPEATEDEIETTISIAKKIVDGVQEQAVGDKRSVVFLQGDGCIPPWKPTLEKLLHPNDLTGKNAATILGALAENYPDVPIAEMAEIARVQNYEHEKKQLLDKYAEKSITEFIQIDAWRESPHGDGPAIISGRTQELMDGPDGVRVLIKPDASPGVAVALLEDAIDSIKNSHPVSGLFRGSDSEIPF